MLNKVIIIASTAGLTSSASVEAKARLSQAFAAASNKPSSGKVVDTSSIDMSAVVEITVGAWADEYVDSCDPAGLVEPIVYGHVLGACQADGSTGSKIDDSCGWNAADKTSLYVKSRMYTTNDCTGTVTSSTVEYPGLVDGCGLNFGTIHNYQCGADVDFTNYGSHEHVENYGGTVCAGEGNSWSVYYYGSCVALADCEAGTYRVDSNSAFSSQEVCHDPTDDDVCFHVESKIDYKGVEYTYEELKAGKEPECTVPHTPMSKGVVISTSCDKTVRVTDTHLMATTKGFQLAYSLKAGDVLFGDYDKEMCVVTSVEKEKTAQQYFGLNCVHSEVLASGLRASTFGDFHTLPSWYMTYVGGMIGSETASSLGEYIAEWYFQKK